TETTGSSKKLRVLLIPFFASSHIGPFTELAVSLATARPQAVEATIAVTPATVPFVRSLLQPHENGSGIPVKVATYPFPAVDGLPKGVENLGAAAQADAWRIDVAALSDTLMRPVQETLIRAQSPDALVTDVHFMWNAGVCDELGVPCVTFNVIGAFSTIAMRHLLGRVSNGEPEASGMAFLWVVRTDKWSPPERWHERVGGRGMVATAWAPQRAILGHRAVGAFVTHCGWNSVLETVAAGVPVLTWPIVFEQFITERLLTQVLGIGERLWPDG
uniref:Uncharacterized protein n=1 Tax=Aegilops tauschii subsp. strangulata TaxID=200361 RepID=A0A453AGT2_AEGTS